MVSLQDWLIDYVRAVQNAFSDRVLFIGIQGSRARGDANRTSDIDVVLILDTLSADDLKVYRDAIAALPDRELMCGFVSGVGELRAWAPGELFAFYYDTVPVMGSLDFLEPLFGARDVAQAVWSGACGVYHMAAHNCVHERSLDLLRELFKSAVFVLKAKWFLETGRHVSRRLELAEVLKGDDLKVLQTANALKDGQLCGEDALDVCTDLLLRWAGDLIRTMCAQEGTLESDG